MLHQLLTGSCGVRFGFEGMLSCPFLNLMPCVAARLGACLRQVGKIPIHQLMAPVEDRRGGSLIMHGRGHGGEQRRTDQVAQPYCVETTQEALAITSVPTLDSEPPFGKVSELVPGERYPQMIQIASLAPTSR